MPLQFSEVAEPIGLLKIALEGHDFFTTTWKDKIIDQPKQSCIRLSRIQSMQNHHGFFELLIGLLLNQNSNSFHPEGCCSHRF